MILLVGNHLSAVDYIQLLSEALVFETIKRLGETVGLLFGSNNMSNVDNCAVELPHVVVLGTDVLRAAINAVKSIDNVDR